MIYVFLRVAFACAMGIIPSLAYAQYKDAGGNTVPGYVPLVGCTSSVPCTGPVSNSAPLPVSLPSSQPVADTNSAAFLGAVPMTVGTTYTAARSVRVIASVAGNVVFQFPDASTITEAVNIGAQIFPYACTQIVSAGTTPTATYYNLK